VFGFVSRVKVMKTELVARWVVVDGHLELKWLKKDSNQVVQSSPPKVVVTIAA
jgi:hypothetical protein